MSYILDALKKAEENRRQDKSPDLMTVHEKQDTATKKRSPWPYILIAAILLNAAVVAVWLIPRQNTKEGTIPELIIEEKENHAVTQTGRKMVTSIPEKNESEVSADPVIAEESETPLTKEPSVLEDDETEMNASLYINADGRIPDINELPLSFKEDLPDIKISGHVFFDNPSDRLIIVNGRPSREGDIVASGLKIEEITSSGVIFIYDDRRFSMKGF